MRTSLTEVLVICVITLILASILIPSLINARSRGVQAQTVQEVTVTSLDKQCSYYRIKTYASFDTYVKCIDANGRISISR